MYLVFHLHNFIFLLVERWKKKSLCLMHLQRDQGNAQETLGILCILSSWYGRLTWAYALFDPHNLCVNLGATIGLNVW